MESRVCQVSSTKRVLITGPEEGSRALPDRTGKEPVCRPLSSSPSPPGLKHRGRNRKKKKKSLENTQAGWGAETYVKLNSNEKQLDQTNLKHDQNKNSICGFFWPAELSSPGLLCSSIQVLWGNILGSCVLVFATAVFHRVRDSFLSKGLQSHWRGRWHSVLLVLSRHILSELASLPSPLPAVSRNKINFDLSTNRTSIALTF